MSPAMRVINGDLAGMPTEMAPDEPPTLALEKIGELSPVDFDKLKKRLAKAHGVTSSALAAQYSEQRTDFKKQQKRQESKPKPPAPEEARTTFLDPPTPWPDFVDGAELLTEIDETVRRFVVMPEHTSTAVTLWTAHAHFHGTATISPILAIESAEKRCGKSTLLSLLQGLVPKPLTSANMTTATVFRAIDEFQPTLLIDEADTFITAEKTELIGTLNSGHNKRVAHVIRLVGDNHETKVFSTWCPKAIALIGELPSTLQDRAIVAWLRRRKKDERVERRRGDRNDDLTDLCSKLARFAADSADWVRNADPVLPDCLNDRAADNWRHLIAIADTAGGDWPQLARDAAIALSGAVDVEEDTGGIRLLADIRHVLRHEASKTPTALKQALCAMPEAPWKTWGRGAEVTERAIARLLKPYGIKSAVARHERGVSRFYWREDFIDAWDRYLPEEIISERDRPF